MGITDTRALWLTGTKCAAKAAGRADSAFNFHMCYMVPVQEEGLTVLPTHRLLKEFKLTDQVLRDFENFFDISKVDPTVEGLESFLRSHTKEHAFCVYDRLESLRFNA